MEKGALGVEGVQNKPTQVVPLHVDYFELKAFETL